MKKQVVGIGEVLWDMLPAGKHLGGAPANFAYLTTLLGDVGVVASRVGCDELGEKAIAELGGLGVPVTYLQRDEGHRTGVVQVEVDAQGVPKFDIAQPVAWDFLEWSSSWEDLARSADAVCFGSLAQRSPQSRETIRRFLETTRKQAVRIFDVNLRPPFYPAEVVWDSMKLADIIKLNDEELPIIMELCSFTQADERTAASRLMERFGLKLVCVTRGGRGSLLVGRGEAHEEPALRVKIADTVGAGDAFTAALVHEYLRGATLEQMNRAANRVGAWVASQSGPTPRPRNGDLESSLAEIPRATT